MPTPARRSPASAAARLDSPCVNVCRMDDAHGWCEGCLRTLDEIGAWSRLDDDERRSVLRLLPARRRVWREERGLAPAETPAE